MNTGSYFLQAQIWGPSAGLQISGYKPACRRCRALPAPFGGLTLRKAKAAAWSLRQQGSVPGHYPDPVKEALASAWGLLFCTHLLIAFAAFLFASFSFLVKRKRSGGPGRRPRLASRPGKGNPLPGPLAGQLFGYREGTQPAAMAASRSLFHCSSAAWYSSRLMGFSRSFAPLNFRLETPKGAKGRSKGLILLTQ